MNVLNEKIGTSINYDEIDIYLKYDELSLYHVLQILNGLNRLHNEIVTPLRNINPFDRDSIFYQPGFHSYNNILKVNKIETGHSIRFHFCEGWLPKCAYSYSSGKKEKVLISYNDLDIGIPKNLGIPIIIIYFLFLGATKIADFQKGILEIELKKLEIKMKELEIYKELNDNDNFSRIDILKKEAIDTIYFMHNCDEINYFELNGLKLKDTRK